MKPTAIAGLVPLIALLLALPGAVPARAASSPQVKSSSPVKNFRLPLFDDAGLRTSFMHADEAVIVSSTRIDAKNLTLTLYASDGSGRTDSLLTSPAASAYTDRQVVTGPGFVRFVHDDVEVTGEHWTYFHREKRVLIENNVRVTFRDELKDLIK